MLVYNVTIKVEKAIAEEWLQWMLNEYIPQIMATNCFSTFNVLKLLDVDDSEGPTYAIQYVADENEGYERYKQQFFSVHNQSCFDRWGNGFIAFRTIMEVVK